MSPDARGAFRLQQASEVRAEGERPRAPSDTHGETMRANRPFTEQGERAWRRAELGNGWLL